MAKAPSRRADAPPTVLPTVSPEETARRTLAWGGGALILGLALVGVGSEDLGVLPALAGLLLLVYGIHKYGRLGPEEEPVPAAISHEEADPEAPAPVHPYRQGATAPAGPASLDLDAAQGAVWTGVWMGGLVAVAGLAVVLGSAGGSGVKVLVAYGAIFGGGFRVLRGLSAISRLSHAPALVAPRVDDGGSARRSAELRPQTPVDERVEKRVEKRRRMNKSAPP